jgi:hypothetical protein
MRGWDGSRRWLLWIEIFSLPADDHPKWHFRYPLVIQHSYGKSPFLMGKSTISMAIFTSFLYVYRRVWRLQPASSTYFYVISSDFPRPGGGYDWRATRHGHGCLGVKMCGQWYWKTGASREGQNNSTLVI